MFENRRPGDITVEDADKTQILEDGYVRFRTVFIGEADYIWDLYQHEEEWREIDAMVRQYQKQFQEGAGAKERLEADEAGLKLLERFQPLFKKYILLLTTGQINFHNTEQKLFVRLFVYDKDLQKALTHKYVRSEQREVILQQFNFLIEGYGHQ